MRVFYARVADLLSDELNVRSEDVLITPCRDAKGKQELRQWRLNTLSGECRAGAAQIMADACRAPA
jgi:hypothetical protein